MTIVRIPGMQHGADMLVIERQDFRKTERELVNSCRGYRFSIVSFPKETPAGARDEMFRLLQHCLYVGKQRAEITEHFDVR